MRSACSEESCHTGVAAIVEVSVSVASPRTVPSVPRTSSVHVTCALVWSAPTLDSVATRYVPATSICESAAVVSQGR